MKAKSLALLAGASAPLMVTGSAEAEFTGVKITVKDNPYGLHVVNVYATFDRPGEDRMISVAGTPNNQLTVEVLGGTFYQHPFGGDRPPDDLLVASFPSLAFDTFVTIGVKSVGPPDGQPSDNLVLTPGWPGFGESTLRLTSNGWAVTPDAPQGDPFNPDYVAGNGQVLIGQFSTADGVAIQGTMLLGVVSNGQAIQQIVSFTSLPAPGAVALIAAAGLIGTDRKRRRRRTACEPERPPVSPNDPL